MVTYQVLGEGTCGDLPSTVLRAMWRLAKYWFEGYETTYRELVGGQNSDLPSTG